MEEALLQYLISQTAITDIVESRIYWGVRTQGSLLPAVVLTPIAQPKFYTHKEICNLQSWRVQVDCYADSYKVSKLLGRLIRESIQGVRVGGIEAIFIDSGRDLSAGDTSEEQIHRDNFDLIVHFRSE